MEDGEVEDEELIITAKDTDLKDSKPVIRFSHNNRKDYSTTCDKGDGDGEAGFIDSQSEDEDEEFDDESATFLPKV